MDEFARGFSPIAEPCVNIEVMPVIISSNPVEESGMARSSSPRFGLPVGSGDLRINPGINPPFARPSAAMIRRHPWLLLLPVVAAAVLLPIALTKLLGGDHGLWSMLCFLPFFLALWLLNPVLIRLDVDLEMADLERRLKPVQQTVEACGLMVEKKEPDYQGRLLKQILRTLNVAAKLEAPLPTGTRVDAYMEFGDEDWYITIKRGLDNQKRLILQGEIEDIILHAPRRDRDLWICVVVGLSEEDDANELAHFKALCEYATQRSIMSMVRHPLEQKDAGHHINIEVMYAVIPSTPLTPEELQELELAAVPA